MWSDWKWQAENCITNPDEVCKEKIKCNFNMRITPYYAGLMENDEKCAIRKQAIPTEEENIIYNDKFVQYGVNLYDSLAEREYSPVKHLVHRYPDRVLIEATNNCFMYCRFCTRKRLTRIDKQRNDLTETFEYIRNNKCIRDVLISGGDPLTLEDNELETIISILRSIEHVEIIRIGTRAPVVLPMRITNDLVNMLKKYHPIWINTHFNHPKEVTPESENACCKLANAGIPLGNQSVLLKGINDNVEVYKELCTKLVKMRVRPYYLYQCDLGMGIEHFRTEVKKGIEMIQSLRQNITGFAIPNFVIDAPNGGGKISINPDNVIDWNNEYIKLKNYKGDVFIYPEVSKKET